MSLLLSWSTLLSLGKVAVAYVDLPPFSYCQFSASPITVVHDAAACMEQMPLAAVVSTDYLYRVSVLYCGCMLCSQ